jgi:hypothetical protein
MHNGDFSELLASTQIYNPFTTTQVCCAAQGNPYFTRQSFPKQPDRLEPEDAVGKKILAFYLLNSPGLQGATKNLDFAVAKGFDITERFKAQFRAEFLNAFNHPPYGGENYGKYYGSSNISNCLDCRYPFGQVIGTRNDRAISR